MKRLLFAGTALIAATLLPYSAKAQDVLKIGVILPYGQFADTATQIDGGIKLYMKQHGDTVAGRKIEIIRKDVGGINPPVAKRLAEELVVRDQVDILADFCSDPKRDRGLQRVGRGKEADGGHERGDVGRHRKIALLHAHLVHAADGNAETGAWAAKSGIKKVYTMVSDYAPGHDFNKVL